MFTKNQPVKCVDAQMDGCGPALNEAGVYHVREFTPPEVCAHDHCEWHLNGGRIELMELPGGSGAGFYGRRFVAAN